MPIIALSNRCRLCASLSPRLLPVDPEVGSRISTLFQVQIGQTMEDKLPRNVCPNCLDCVNNAWLFLERVHRAQRELLENSLRLEVKSEVYYVAQSTLEIPSISDEIIHEEVVERRGTLSYEDCPQNVDEVPVDAGDSWPDYPWNCNVCGETYSTVGDFKKHRCFQLHKRYFCADCPKSYTRLQLFRTHVTQRHWERHQKHLLLQCDICHSWFDSEEAQQLHRAADHPQAPPRPPLRRPMQTPKIIYECDQCGKRFGTKPSFDVHRKLHSGIKNFTCDQCGKSFSQKGNLAAHLLTHSSTRPFSCAVCEKTFKTLVRLRKHLDVHSGRKPHVCDVCGREFRERGTLRIHVRIHTGAMPYTCEFCGKTFRFKGVLTTHRRQHTGERPYSCLECQHHFTNWPNYNKHMVRRHGVNTSVRTRKPSAVPPTGRPQRNPPGTVLAPPQLPPAPIEPAQLIGIQPDHGQLRQEHHVVQLQQQQQQQQQTGVQQDHVVELQQRDHVVQLQQTSVQHVQLQQDQTSVQHVQLQQDQTSVQHVQLQQDHVQLQQQDQTSVQHLQLQQDHGQLRREHVVQLQQELQTSVQHHVLETVGPVVNVLSGDQLTVYQTGPATTAALIGVDGSGGGYYATYGVGGIAHVVTQ